MKVQKESWRSSPKWIATSLAGVLLACSLAACDDATSPSTDAATAQSIRVSFATPRAPAVTIMSAGATHTPTPAASSAFTPTPSPSATVATPDCLATPNLTIPAKPATFAEGVSALGAYLNAGATLTTAMEAAQNWGYIYADPVANQVWGGGQGLKLVAGDTPQIVLTLFDATQADPQNPGTHVGDLAVFSCERGQHVLAYQAAADPLFSGVVLNPRILSDADVTGDGLGDLSFVTGECGAESCVDALTVVSAQGASAGAPAGQLHNILPDIDAISLANPTFTFVPAANGSGKDILAITGLISATSAGPQRVMTETWAFNGTIFTRTASTLAPPVYRIHALHDGDAAFRRKDFATAEALYLRVVNDPALQTWEGDAPLQDEASILAAMAYVRLIQTAAARGDAVAAQAALDALTAAAPAGSSGEIYAELGSTFFSAFQQSNDYAKACAAAIAYAGDNPNTYLTLGQDTYGYANPDYTAGEMCVP